MCGRVRVRSGVGVAVEVEVGSCAGMGRNLGRRRQGGHGLSAGY